MQGAVGDKVVSRRRGATVAVAAGSQAPLVHLHNMHLLWSALTYGADMWTLIKKTDSHFNRLETLRCGVGRRKGCGMKKSSKGLEKTASSLAYHHGIKEEMVWCIN